MNNADRFLVAIDHIDDAGIVLVRLYVVDPVDYKNSHLSTLVLSGASIYGGRYDAQHVRATSYKIMDIERDMTDELSRINFVFGEGNSISFLYKSEFDISDPIGLA